MLAITGGIDHQLIDDLAIPQPIALHFHFDRDLVVVEPKIHPRTVAGIARRVLLGTHVQVMQLQQRVQSILHVVLVDEGHGRPFCVALADLPYERVEVLQQVEQLRQITARRARIIDGWRWIGVGPFQQALLKLALRLRCWAQDEKQQHGGTCHERQVEDQIAGIQSDVDIGHIAGPHVVRRPLPPGDDQIVDDHLQPGHRSAAGVELVRAFDRRSLGRRVVALHLREQRRRARPELLRQQELLHPGIAQVVRLEDRPDQQQIAQRDHHRGQHRRGQGQPPHPLHPFDQRPQRRRRRPMRFVDILHCVAPGLKAMDAPSPPA
ncbi:hypothetical protein CEK69_07055 [Xanthomonas sp. LMG 12462]|nr:hypothetical protein CEK69_07055 [Xanthomonas sp. LMG 12462]